MCKFVFLMGVYMWIKQSANQCVKTSNSHMGAVVTQFTGGTFPVKTIKMAFWWLKVLSKTLSTFLKEVNCKNKSQFIHILKLILKDCCIKSTGNVERERGTDKGPC